MGQAQRNDGASIVALDKFIQATRDSGYKGTASALSELVDNALQADATEIQISVNRSRDAKDQGLEVSVLDNGCGMDPFTLRQALRFGGSTRFGDRTGLGRYGMGLPNSSLSQARRVDVYTWQAPSVSERSGSRKKRSRRRSDKAERVYTSYLDVDEIVRGEMGAVPRPKVEKEPPEVCTGDSGTLVVWRTCDRLDNRRATTIRRKVAREIGRRFRYFIWDGVRIVIDGEEVEAIDPLYLRADAEISGGEMFGDDLEQEIRVDAEEQGGGTGWVRVKFSELPVHEWYRLSNSEKRRIGISKGAGVSIVRAGREVDYGWFFMGVKRRENYDDWWRCELQFDPILDEAFGITHTKQQIRPRAHVVEALTPDLEALARALNSRARKAHLAARSGELFSEAERVATEREHLLRPLPANGNPQARSLMGRLKKRNASLRETMKGKDGRRYKIIEAALPDSSFFSFALDGDRLLLVLNPDHPFYRELYSPLVDGQSAVEQQVRAKLELVLLAAARAEAARGARAADSLAKHRLDWSDTLATFLNG